MKIQVLQHVAHEGPAAIAAWAAERGHTLAITRLDHGESPPDIDSFGALVVMGGPMSVHDEAAHPWLAEEIRFLQQVVQHDRRVLGVCLGAQLIAAALGCRVVPAPTAEIGWYPVTLLPAAARSRTFAGMPPRMAPFHWHGETFDLPEGALHLASSERCPNQAFEVEFDGGPERGGGLVLALQFHLEATEASVRAMIDADGASLACAPGAPDPADPLADPSRWEALRPLLDDALDRLTS